MKARLFLAFIERIREVVFYFFGCKASIFFYVLIGTIYIRVPEMFLQIFYGYTRNI